jgi:tetratricopeptide (TPR) repeat protein
MTAVTQSADAIIRKVKTREAEAKQFKLDGDYQDAIDILGEAIDLIEESGWRERVDSVETPTNEDRDIAAHLAECFGMMGGNYRALPDGLQSALKCFASGGKYEADARFNLESSYSLVNELVIPIEMGTTMAQDLLPNLEKAASVLERQVQGPRRLDRWAWADLGECRLLAGKLEGAVEAYRRFKELAEPRQIRSARVVLERLAEAVQTREPELAGRVLQGAEILV